MSRSNGHAESEVIVSVCIPNHHICCFSVHTLYVQFSDGGAYSKAKMEDAYRAVSSDKPQAKPTKALSAPKRDDVDLIVSNAVQSSCTFL